VLVGIDGQCDLKASTDDAINISIAKMRLPLAQRRGYSHFSVVRTKLKWSGGAVDHGTS
jgi:NAD+ kinase